MKTKPLFTLIGVIVFLTACNDGVTVEPKSPARTSSQLSMRAKCTIDCYARCARTGETKAVYCNCPLRNVEDTVTRCNPIGIEANFRENSIDRAPRVELIYKDVRTIWLRIDAFHNAFIYVFEFADVEPAVRPSWHFAGASSSPEITFSVPDPCRDYQVRAIVVLRSDATRSFVVLRAQPILVRLPLFEVPLESIRLDFPKESSDGQSVQVSVGWHHPAGYEAEDIYGYESPTAYPIRCMTPESHLSQPRVELVEGGARMHLHLPVDVLQERCKIYMEVRIVPKCSRIESFDLQASVELDCQKFPNLNYCRKEVNPQCTNVVDLWGLEDGMAAIVWQPPNSLRQAGTENNSNITAPLYYSINFGKTQVQGNGSLARMRIVEMREIRTTGNTTRSEIGPLRAGVRYGVQVCGIYSSGMSQSPFHIVPVIGFQCEKCQRPHKSPHCLECTKMDEMDPHQSGDQKVYAAVNDRSEPVLGATSNNYIASNTATLNVLTPGSKHDSKSEKMLNSEPLISLSLGDAAAADNLSSASIEDLAFSDRIDVFQPLQRHSKTVSTSRIIPIDKNVAKSAEFEQDLLFSKKSRSEDSLAESQRASRDLFLASSKLFSITTTSGPLESSAAIVIGTTVPPPTTAFVIRQSAIDHLQPPAISSTIASLSRHVGTSLAEPGELRFAQAKGHYQKQRARIDDNFAAAGHFADTPFNIVDESANIYFNTKPSANGTLKIGEEKTTIVGKVEFVTGGPPMVNSTRPSDNGFAVTARDPSPIDRPQSHRPDHCRLSDGVICESRCSNDRLRPTITCIRGILCPFISYLRADYDRTANVIALRSAELSDRIRNLGTYDKIVLELDAASKNVFTQYVPIERSDESSVIFDESRPYCLHINGDRTRLKASDDYNMTVCFVQSATLPRQWLNNSNDHESFRARLSAYGYTSIRSNRVDLRPVVFDRAGGTTLATVAQSSLGTLDDKAIEQPITVQRLVVFIGPTFFILGMVMFGVVLLCLCAIRRQRRGQRLRFYSSASLKKFDGSHLPANSAVGCAPNISAPLFNSSTINTFFGGAAAGGTVAGASLYATPGVANTPQATYAQQYNAYGSRRLQSGTNFQAFGSGNSQTDVAEAGMSTITTVMGRQSIIQDDVQSIQL